MINCQEARNAITILEVECTQCGDIVEVFVKDGVVCTDSVCTVCGKGGCGKSTVTTLLAKELARMEKKVLVVDSDESNFGLHRQLGVELPRDFTEYFGGKDKAFKTMMTSGILDSMKLSAFAKKFFCSSHIKYCS